MNQKTNQSKILTSVLIILFLSGLWVSLTMFPTFNIDGIEQNNTEQNFSHVEQEEYLPYGFTQPLYNQTFEWMNYTFATEGVPHADSITSFSETSTDNTALDPDADTNGDSTYAEWDFDETIGDDVLYYPDGEILEVAVSGSGSPIVSGGTYVTTQSSDDSDWYASLIRAGAGTLQYEFDYQLTFTVDDVSYTFRNFVVEYQFENVQNSPTFDSGVVQIYNYDTTSWDTSYTDSGFHGSDVTRSLTGNSNHIDTDGSVKVRLLLTVTLDQWDGVALNWDYSGVFVSYDNEPYLESFTDVSDWTGYSWESGESFTTDGDVATYATEGDSAAESDYIYTNSPSVSSADWDFIEMRYKLSSTDSYYWRLYILDTDASSLIEGRNTYTINEYTDWTTYRWHRNDLIATIDDFNGAVESIHIRARNNEHVDVDLEIDYLRIGSTMGWAHDGSTTEGTFETGGCDISSDGDKLTFSADAASEYGHVLFDTTATAAASENDYYSWIEWSVYSSTDNDADDFVYNIRMVGVDGSTYLGQTNSTGYGRYNIKEDTAAGDFNQFRVYVDDGDSVVFDYVKLYGFNNWTYTISTTNALTSSVAYYDSSEEALVMEKTFDTSPDYMRIQTRNDSIGYATANMYLGITIKASANTSCRIKPYVITPDDSSFYHLYDDYQTIWMQVKDATTLNRIYLYFYDWTDSTPSSGTYQIYIKDNVTVRPSWYDASLESGTYGESFADVSDWSLYSNEGNDAISTDGDVLSWTCENAGNPDSDYIYTNVPSLAAGAYYVEFRYRMNSTSGPAVIFICRTGSEFPDGDTLEISTPTRTTTWTTIKVYIEPSATLESIYVYTGFNAHADFVLYIEYFRIAPATEMGWQDDCSSVSGYTSLGSPVYSDGNIVHIDATQGAGYERYEQDLWLKQADYPFVEFRWKAASAENMYFRVQDENDNWYTYSDLVETGEWVTTRLNIEALTSAGSYIKHYDFYSITASYQEFWIDYTKFYSIANYSFSSGSLDSDDYAYVDSNKLCFSSTLTSPEYMTWNHDPALSVATGTYNVLNVTMNDANPTANTDFEFRDTVSGSETLELTDETRDAIEDTGTLTDFRFTVKDGSIVISAIEFWEDATPPTIFDFWIVPYTPTDSDQVTIVTYATDGVSIYEVNYNAIDAPSGFSDVDYLATESAVQTGLYNYTFTTLDAGYYAWKVTVDDGANIITDILVMQVVENELSISDIVLITTGATDIQISGKTNMDADYDIYEEDVSQGSGSVTEGWFSISWTKETSAGTDINLGIEFTSGIYSEWVNGSYSVASATVLKVSELIYTVTDTLNVLSGSTNLDCTYSIFEEGIEQETGSLSAGRFSSSWTRDTTVGNIDWAVSFATNCSQTVVDAISLQVGTPIGGNVASMGTVDTNYYNYTETAGTPASYLMINFTASVFRAVDIRMYYDGNAGHNLWFQLYDYNEDTWDNIVQIVDDTGFDWYNQSIESYSEYVSGGVVRGRLYHISPGNINHHIHIDYIALCTADAVEWVKGSYYNSAETAYESHVVILDNLFELVPFDNFEVYLDGSRIYHDLVQVTNGDTYNITIKNRFGDTVNSTIFDADFEMVVFVNTYSFKFMNWYNGFLRVNVTRAGVTYSEIIMPTEIIEFNLYASTYTFTVDFLNGTTKFSQEINVQNSTGYVITGDTLTDVFDLVTSTYAMTNAINITVTATNEYALTISIDLLNINSTIDSQLIQVLLNITNVNSTIYDQTVDLLAYIQNVNTTLYSQTATFIVNVYNNHTTIYDQTVDILTQLSIIGSNVTANYISLSAELLAIDSNLYANFTSVAASLIAIDSSLLSNFTAVTSTLTAIGTNITTNYLDVVSTLSLIDSQLASNFTNIVSQLLSVNSSIASQFITVVAYAADMNTTMYLIDDPTHLNPLVLGSDLSDDYCDFTIVTTWHNATVRIYDNDVLRAGPTSELLSPIRYPLSITSGTHNLSVYIDGGNDNFWYNISYTVVEIITFEVETSYQFYLTDSYVNFYITTTWGNATIYAYDNSSLVGAFDEGIIYWWKDTDTGLHLLELNVTSGASVLTLNPRYYVPVWSNTRLAVTTFDLLNMQDNYTLITVTTNWQNATIDVYLNGSLVLSNAIEGMFNITRPQNAGLYNLTIVVNATADSKTLQAWIRTTVEGVTTYSTTNNASNYEDYRVTNEGDEVETQVVVEGDFYEGDDPQTEMWETLGIIAFIIAVPVIGGIFYFLGIGRDRRKARQPTITRGTESVREMATRGSKRRV